MVHFHTEYASGIAVQHLAESTARQEGIDDLMTQLNLAGDQASICSSHSMGEEIIRASFKVLGIEPEEKDTPLDLGDDFRRAFRQ